uniref:Uncharacterized protein n=1 Tax=Rhodnius prolixus TaxID=13249 RepID=T1I7I9_RHOPR
MKRILSLVTPFFVAAMAYSYPAELNLQQHIGKIYLGYFETAWTNLGDALREKPAGEITEVHLVRMKRECLRAEIALLTQ